MSSTQPPFVDGSPIPPGMGRLAVDASCPAMAFQVRRNELVIAVDGTPRLGGWGRSRRAAWDASWGCSPRPSSWPSPAWWRR